MSDLFMESSTESFADASSIELLDDADALSIELLDDDTEYFPQFSFSSGSKDFSSSCNNVPFDTGSIILLVRTPFFVRTSLS